MFPLKIKIISNTKKDRVVRIKQEGGNRNGTEETRERPGTHKTKHTTNTKRMN
jgi:hypothetical protein